MTSKLKIIVPADAAGERLDHFLSQRTEMEERSLSRSQIKQLIEKEKLKVNSELVRKSGLILKAKDCIEMELAIATNDPLEPYEFDLDICYEDKELIVLNKPAGISVHPGANTGNVTLLNALVWHYKKTSKKLPSVFDSLTESRGGVVHRLDKDTTGILVVAKTLPSLQYLARQFSDRTIKRLYNALVYSTPRGKRIISEKDSGVIDLPIGRDPLRRVAMGVGGVAQKQAVTEWKVLKRFDYAALLELSLRTGRTHQIRVHMNAIACPVIGDRTYGDFSGLPRELNKTAQIFGRQALHAKTLEFIHPKTKKLIGFDSEIPDDMKSLITKFSV